MALAVEDVTGFGGVRETLVSVLGVVVGQQKAGQYVGDFETLIRTEAEKGAKQAIPQIRKEVRAEVKPYIIAAFGVGGLGLLLGALAYRRK